VIAIVLVGVRHAFAIPAELRANWVFSMAWNGEMRPFVAGVKRAVVAGALAAAQHAARLCLVVDCTGILAAPRKTAADMQRSARFT
jgi:hypothetical protein